MQFEAIHPFLDGNGRLGRLLISFMLHHEGVLSRPLLYLSLYFKAHRQAYYECLDQVRTRGDWVTGRAGPISSWKASSKPRWMQWRRRAAWSL